MQTEFDSSKTSEPAFLYAYCPQSRRMRMMTLNEATDSLRTAFYDFGSFVFGGPEAPGVGRQRQAPWRRKSSRSGPEDSGFKRRPDSCPCSNCHTTPCSCTCHVCDADFLVYGRCGEVRIIPITFENEWRREREISVTLSPWVDAYGRRLDFATRLSENKITLPGCGCFTLTATVQVDCGGERAKPASDDAASHQPGTPTSDEPGKLRQCLVAYADLIAEGCSIRPVRLAIAVLPNDCGGYTASCGCC